MTLQEAKQDLQIKLNRIYNDSEAIQITNLVIQHVTGWMPIDQALNRKTLLGGEKMDRLKQFTIELLQHRPVQYVLKEAWFGNIHLQVDERVLIPRPETEELVDWIVKDLRNVQVKGKLNILDIGTGSGCIALGLKKQLSHSEVNACDISEEALDLAKRNAAENNLVVQFYLLNILNEEDCQRLPSFDCIVSNPPYIPLQDKNSMRSNVIDFEPHLALFVPNDDPLLFYKAIINFAKTNLSRNGTVYLEINEEFGEPVRQLLQQAGFLTIEIRKDMQGKDRMIKGS